MEARFSYKYITDEGEKIDQISVNLFLCNSIHTTVDISINLE